MSAECDTEKRRGQVREARLNGVDGVEVSDDGRTLTVTFLGKAPRRLGPENIRVDGGRRVTGIRATAVEIHREEDPELDDLMRVTIDRPGDTSAYRLAVVEPDPYGRPGTTPYRGFDPRYHQAEFSFCQGRPTPFDCLPEQPEEPDTRPRPLIDYTARDYESLRRLVLDRMSLTTPGWVERHLPDLGVTLAGLLAYTADQISYQQDAVATEAYLDTARLRTSVRRHTRLIDYRMHDGCNARAFVALETSRQLALPRGRFRFAAVDVSRLGPTERPDLGPVLVEEELAALTGRAGVEVFEPLTAGEVTLRPEHNAIPFWTWGDTECTLPKGATSATLRDGAPRHDHGERKTDRRGQRRALRLRPGDVLILEEVIGPRTGTPADADPAHRQAVRLTSVTPLVDEVHDQPVLDIEWAREDALAFDLVISGRAGIDCAPLDDVSVARGNVVLVDHGRSLTHCGGVPETFTVPPEPVTLPPCSPPGCGCADPRPEGSPSAEAIRALLDRARAGRHLTPGQVRELFALLGEDTVIRAGLDIHLAPGSTVSERVEPPTADGQAAALETLLAQVTYPVIPRRFRPVLGRSPVTQAAPHPEPARVAAGQAALLAAIPERLRDRLEELWRAAEDGHPPGRAERAELTTIFGAETLEALRFDRHPAHALRELLARRERLLAAKLRRLDVLVARAGAGGVLDRYVVWEAAQSWGDRYVDGLDPDDPRLAGPAAAAVVQDPRDALPAVRATTAEGGWTPRHDLLASGPRDRHFVGELGEDGRLTLRFGDGRHGAAPKPGALEASYRLGGGTAGNVGAEAIGHLVWCPDERGARSRKPDVRAVVRVRNPLAATGGTEPEPIDEARQLAPLALKRRPLRAVTAADYARLAAETPGVQRAAAELRWTGGSREAHVVVDALGTAEPTPRLLDAVARRLEAYRRIGHDLVVRSATLVPLDIELQVCAAPGYQRGHVLAALRRALGARAGGFFHADALTFGEPVRLSRLIATAAAVPGVASVHATRLRRLFGQDQGELAAGLLAVGPLEIARCDNDPDRPENGRLSLVIGGGR
ncbi:putative baseplate assembly protein [Streptomyces sp. 8K308]|uniref:putative baseplate assembly protein n=1 Tax=Streptomyces sp. 8K308 TaxID=2530388 RepID=UPI00104D238A|nr:putative baseplate assembly protein [Streptomyces sp. 8K308]TDC24599.1 putative baseplate assembly protein [Streptomyces sp. 8K308]